MRNREEESTLFQAELGANREQLGLRQPARAGELVRRWWPRSNVTEGDKCVCVTAFVRERELSH